jgi:TrmH family RNA methyltransferase
MTQMITSLSNENIKTIRALLEHRRAREKSGKFVIEGVHLAQEAVRANVPIDEVFYSLALSETEAGHSLLQSLSGCGASLLPVDDKVMREISETVTPQGLVAVLPIPALRLPEKMTFALISDSVRDPGNMGTILRVAAAAGVSALLVTSGSVDVTSPKVVRSAVGAHFRVPVRQVTWKAIPELLSEHVIAVADSKGGTPYYKVDWTQPAGLIISDEAQGPSLEARQLAHFSVTIPMPGDMESLNVGVATGIIVYDMVRQRLETEGS